ncbi:MAG TPA: hypothetical protein VLZ81_07505, partial [Blastocatellia bacterium]|nr:hypothetical protein [Blastocatellia bacterium]
MRSKLICLAVILTVAVSVRGVASGRPIGSRPIGCSGTKPVARASATDAPTALNIGPGTDEIDAIAVCPNDPDVVFVGTQDAGVWKSTDAGASWASSNSGIKLDSPFELG